MPITLQLFLKKKIHNMRKNATSSPICIFLTQFITNPIQDSPDQANTSTHLVLFLTESILPKPLQKKWKWSDRWLWTHLIERPQPSSIPVHVVPPMIEKYEPARISFWISFYMTSLSRGLLNLKIQYDFTTSVTVFATAVCRPSVSGSASVTDNFICFFTFFSTFLILK